MGEVGGDLAVMDRLKTQFDRQRSTIANLITELDREVLGTVGTGWKGPAADKFAQAWDTDFKKALQNLSEALGSAGEEVKRRRDALARAGGYSG